MAQRVNPLPQLPANMNPQLRRQLIDILKAHAQQINYATGWDIARITSASTVAHDLVLVDVSGTASVAVTVPFAKDWRDRVLRVKKIDTGAGNVSILAQSGETIDGTATIGITTAYTCLQLVSDGKAWYIA